MLENHDFVASVNILTPFMRPPPPSVFLGRMTVGLDLDVTVLLEYLDLSALSEI